MSTLQNISTISIILKKIYYIYITDYPYHFYRISDSESKFSLLCISCNLIHYQRIFWLSNLFIGITIFFRNNTNMFFINIFLFFSSLILYIYSLVGAIYLLNYIKI